MSFEGKVVIVTGSSGGIGASTAVVFAKEGAKVVIVGRNAEKLKKVEDYCKKISRNQPLVIKADISKDDEARGVVSKTVQHFGKLDVLVNNAGIVSFRSITDDDFVFEFDRIMLTNVRAMVVVTNAAVPHLLKTKGNIINVSSVCGKTPVSIKSHYCASKAAMDHFSRSIALELAPKGVRVNVVSPGPVKTDIFDTFDVTEEDKLKKFAKLLPLGFMSESEEVGNLILYLASDKARSITGSDFAIDLGTNLGGLDEYLKFLVSK